jgi:hypothetical protein
LGAECVPRLEASRCRYVAKKVQEILQPPHQPCQNNRFAGSDLSRGAALAAVVPATS